MSQEPTVIPDYDVHIHTWLSPCGARAESLSSVAAYAAEARRYGVSTIGISDHFALPYPWTTGWANSGPAIIVEARRQAAQISDGTRVLIGCETDLIAPERVNIDAAYARTLDFVIISPTHFDSKEVFKRASASPAATAEHMVALTALALELPFVDVLAHPFTVPEERLGSPEDYMRLVSDAALMHLAKAAASNRIAFEMNGRMSSMPVYRAAMRRLYTIARAEGVKFTVGSDSHQIRHMARLDAIEAYARELGLTREDFLSVEELTARHHERG